MPFPNLSGREPIYIDEEATKKVAEYLVKIDLEKKTPTAEGLANYMDITTATVKLYLNKPEEYKHFIASYRKMMNLQADDIIQNGLKNKYNSNVVKLLLYNHGYRDRSDVTSDNKQISFSVTRGK